MDNILVSVVLYNAQALVKDYVYNLESQNVSLTLFITDNASSDTTKDIIDELLTAKLKYVVIKYKRFSENIGYTAAINYVINEEFIKNDYSKLILSNYDVRFESNFLKSILNQCSSVNITVPKMRNGNNQKKFWYTRGVICKLSPLGYRTNISVLPWERTSFAPGTFWIIPRIIVEAVGLFDERNYFVYWEDLDYSIRMKNSGYKFFVSDLYIDHFVSSSLRNDDEKKIRLYSHGQRNFILKHYPTFIANLIISYVLFYHLFRFLIRRESFSLIKERTKVLWKWV